MTRASVATAAAFALVGSLLPASAGGAPGLESGARASADRTPPAQTIFAASRQSVSSLYLLITVHERGNLKVTARAGRYRYRGYDRSVVAHIPNQVRLKLSASAARSARRALRNGTSMRATVKSTARDGAGNRRTYTKRIKLKP